MADRKRTGRLDWEDVRHFVALARQGSLSATARALGVNHATVARRIAGLEATLGRPLFDRRPEGYALTAEGRAILDAATAMDEAAMAVRHRLEAGSALSGTVRLATTYVLADRFLIARLGGLRERHPLIELEILAGSRLVSLPRREADLALRLGRPRDGVLVGRRVAQVAFGFYAAPAWAEQLAGGAEPVLIGFDEDSAFVPEAGWLAQRFPERRPAIRCNSQTGQAMAARAGLGVALLPRFVGEPDAGLVEVGLGPLPPSRELWLLTRPNLTRVPRVRAVADWVAEMVRAERGVLAG